MDFVVDQLLSCVQLFVAPWAAAHQASLSFIISWSFRVNSCPLNQWCQPTISSFVAPFPCPQSFPESGSFPMSWLFPSGGQSIAASASASVLPMNIQSSFPLRLTGLIFFLSKKLSRVFYNNTVQKHQFFGAQPSLWFASHIIHDYWEKTIVLTIRAFVSKVMSLLLICCLGMS